MKYSVEVEKLLKKVTVAWGWVWTLCSDHEINACVCVYVCVQDVQIEREKGAYNISGGCTALVAICLLGKLYVANAGDSR